MEDTHWSRAQFVGSVAVFVECIECRVPTPYLAGNSIQPNTDVNSQNPSPLMQKGFRNLGKICARGKNVTGTCEVLNKYFISCHQINFQWFSFYSVRQRGWRSWPCIERCFNSCKLKYKALSLSREKWIQLANFFVVGSWVCCLVTLTKHKIVVFISLQNHFQCAKNFDFDYL